MIQRRRTNTRRSFNTRRPRSNYQWQDGLINETIQTASQEFHDITGAMVTDRRKGAVLVRCILKLTYFLVTAGTGGIISMGMTLLDQDAVNAVALPEADVMADQPGWFHRERVVVSSSDVNDRSQATQQLVDVKPKRKLQGANDVVGIIWDSGALSANVNIDGMVRALWQLP